MIGRTIAHYQILEKIGEGGMGAVYKARDTRLNRFVAIKVLPAEKVASPDRKARFVQEARAASALNHPNIVTIHDIASFEEGELIVMEYIAGKPLSEVIVDKEFRLSDILRWAAQIADALAAAHAAGIVHRDLKPSNLMISETGLVKVLDFGLAKLAAGSTAADMKTLTLPRTDPGMIIGTVGYMSPEQVRGQELDRRTDIFNFGLILYEMLSGTRAFQGDTSVDVMSSILKEMPAELPESVPGPLRQIVSVCLEKNPANRFESARDLGFALRALAAGPSATGALLKIEPTSEKRKWALPIALSALAAMSVIAIVLVALYLRRPSPLDLSTYKFTPFATDAEPESQGIWSPDGKSIAYLKRLGRHYQLMWRSLDAPMPIQVTKLPGGVSQVSFWSPDENLIYFISGSSLWSVGIAGGEPQQILPGIVNGATLSPDGKTLAFWKRSEQDGKITNALWISSPPGSTPRRYSPAPFEFHTPYIPVYLGFSPDGSHLGLSRYSTGGGAEFWLLDWPDGSKARPRRLFKNRNFASPPSFGWMADSRYLVMSVGGNLWQADIKTEKLQQITASVVAGYSFPSVSRDGRRIVVNIASTDYDIFQIPLDGSKPQPLVATSQLEISPSWSSSGDRMAFITDRSGKMEIWLRSSRGDWERPIVTQKDFPDEEIRFRCVIISPDGNRVAYSRRGTRARTKIWISSASGGKPAPATPGEEQDEYGLSWSPDGSSIVFFTFKEGILQLAVVRVGSQRPSYSIPGTEGWPIGAPAWSPDGKWIACGSSKESTIVLVSPDGKESRSLASPATPSGQNFVLIWSRDSSAIYVASSIGETSLLYEVDIKTGKSRKIVSFGNEVYFGLQTNNCLTASLTADGKSFVTTVNIYKSDLWILEGFPQPGRRRQ